MAEIGAAEFVAAVVEGYVLEGHVSAADVERLLRERPAINRKRDTCDVDGDPCPYRP